MHTHTNLIYKKKYIHIHSFKGYQYFLSLLYNPAFVLGFFSRFTYFQTGPQVWPIDIAVLTLALKSHSDVISNIQIKNIRRLHPTFNLNNLNINMLLIAQL